MLKIKKECLDKIYDVLYANLDLHPYSRNKIYSLLTYDFSSPGIVRVNILTDNLHTIVVCFSKDTIYVRCTNSTKYTNLNRYLSEIFDLKKMFTIE